MITFKKKLYDTSEEEPQVNDLVIDGHGDVGYLDYVEGTPVLKSSTEKEFFSCTLCINPKKLVEVTEE